MASFLILLHSLKVSVFRPFSPIINSLKSRETKCCSSLNIAIKKVTNKYLWKEVKANRFWNDCQITFSGILDLVQWFSNGATLPLGGYFENVWRQFWFSQLEVQGLLLASSDQGCCWTSYNGWVSPPEPRIFHPKCQSCPGNSFQNSVLIMSFFSVKPSGIFHCS